MEFPWLQKEKPAEPTIKQPELATKEGQIKPDALNPGDPNALGVAVPTDPPKPVHPLDIFKDILQTDPNKKTVEAPKLAITDEMLDKIMPNLDFMAGLPPEIAQGLTTGDPAAIAATIKHVGESTYKMAMQHQATVVNDHVEQALKAYKPQVDSQVDTNLTNQKLANLANSDNPVVQQELQRVAGLLRAKYPTAPNEWIAEQSNEYLTQLGATLNPQAAKTPPAEQQVDFAKLLEHDES